MEGGGRMKKKEEEQRTKDGRRRVPVEQRRQGPRGAHQFSLAWYAAVMKQTTTPALVTPCAPRARGSAGHTPQHSETVPRWD
jgi:hypothetical protein